MAKKRGVQMGIIYGIYDLIDRHEKYGVIKNDIVENVDVCIIGSGAAGAVLAKEFVQSGMKVVLIERGGYHEGKDMNQREADMMPLLWKNAGFNFVDSLRIAIAQGCCLGGSTIINDAVCFDTPPRVRQEWNSLGVNFTDNEWSDHLEKVNATLHVTRVSDDELNRNNLMLKKGAEKLGLREHRNNYRNCVNCMQCGFCHIGCHYETKQNVLVTYLHEALKKPDSDIRVYCNCYIEKIIHSNGTVEGVEGNFLDIDGNKTFRIRVNAKIIIVSAGAIASSKLLLQNGIAQETAGVGLCLHPGIEVIGDFDYEIKGNQGIPMAYTVHDFGVTRNTDQTRKDYNFDAGEFLIESIFLPLFQFSIALSGSGIGEHRRLIERFNNYAMAGIVVRDDNIGRVALTSTGRASVTYNPREKELKILAKGVEVVGKMWFALGANKIIISHRSMSIIENEGDLPKIIDKILNDPNNLLLGSAHPQSGNKIGTDQANSVVDSDCRVHGFKNLFVCDASVFPTSVGVNPQITVMTVASIVASRIIKDWQNKYNNTTLKKSLGNTCAISQPMYCLRSNLSSLFDSMNTQSDAEILVNSVDEKAEEANWKFDPASMMISNNSHWKGIFSRDTNIQNTLTLYFGGFWKRFTKNQSGDIAGTTHPFEVPVFARNKAINKEFDGLGKVILLEYLDAPYNIFYDLLKIVDENTILGKAFLGKPSSGREILTFSMSRKYPFEFMTEEDHGMLYSKMKKPALESMIGIWEGRLVSDSTWSEPIFKFRYYFDKDNKTLKNDYVFGNILAGTAIVNEKEDRVEMQDVTTGTFHDEIRQINDNTLIGKYYSDRNQLFRWLPRGLIFLYIDMTGPSIYLPYILKRVGTESAFRNGVG
ncbi:MAG TPA: GMC family oxidoreductase [Nitrososphaeraceae archaeon]|nr:GMC family oxidoreductase [Nitrososphaeraceae archaeon]